MTTLLALVYAEGSTSLGLTMSVLPRLGMFSTVARSVVLCRSANKYRGRISTSPIGDDIRTSTIIPGSTLDENYGIFLVRPKECYLQYEAGFWVHSEVTVKSIFFRNVAPCSLETALRFGGTYNLHLQGRNEKWRSCRKVCRLILVVPPKRRDLPEL